jgi:excisionase family DNA binding protein
MRVQVEIEPLLLRGGEVAELLGCSRALAFRWMQRGILPTVRVPGARSVRVPRAALIKWIDEQTNPPEAKREPQQRAEETARAEGERISTPPQKRRQANRRGGGRAA